MNARIQNSSSLHFHCASTTPLFNDSRGSRLGLYLFINQPAPEFIHPGIRSFVSRIFISHKGGSVMIIIGGEKFI